MVGLKRPWTAQEAEDGFMSMAWFDGASYFTFFEEKVASYDLIDGGTRNTTIEFTWQAWKEIFISHGILEVFFRTSILEFSSIYKCNIHIA